MNMHVIDFVLPPARDLFKSSAAWQQNWLLCSLSEWMRKSLICIAASAGLFQV